MKNVRIKIKNRNNDNASKIKKALKISSNIKKGKKIKEAGVSIRESLNEIIIML